jgi:hypothetical protein
VKIKIETTDEIIATHGGSLLLGEIVNKTALRAGMSNIDGTAMTEGIPTGDVVLSYVGTLAQAQTDFEAIEQFRKDPYFAQTLGIKTVPSSSTLRQRIDALGEVRKDAVIARIMRESSTLLKTVGAQISPCFGEYVPLDVDVAPFDNSDTKKEGVSYTYKGFDGYAPIFAYLGAEGYCVNAELRNGSQHCQKHTPEFLQAAVDNARLATDQRILVRMDSGNDAAENIELLQKSGMDFIIKRNPRKESPRLHFSIAEEKGVELPDTRDGKRVFAYEITTKPKDCKPIREVTFATERTSKADGQLLLVPEYEIESYHTSLGLAHETVTPQQVQKLYHDHGTSEQFHSELKTDLDLERLPSGKFATNAIVLALGVFTYNCLRIIGQESLKVSDYPKTPHKVKRRRIRTVIDRYISLAVKLVNHARTLFVKLSKYNPWYRSFKRMYEAFST